VKNPYRRLSILRAEAVLKDRKTILRNISFTAPLKVLPPHPLPGLDGGIRATQLNVSAGIMAGDRQKIRLRIGAGAVVEWTSQSYEKIHRMHPGDRAERQVILDLAPAAQLCYRPLPVIPFGGSDFRGHTRINLADESSRLIYADIFCAGRIARQEAFHFRRYRQVLEIFLGGRLGYRDNTDFRPGEDGGASGLPGIGLFEGRTHTASLILCNTGCTLAQIREIFSPAKDAAATMAEGGILLIKALGNSAQELEFLLDQLIGQVTNQRILQDLSDFSP
jgi:urease accessory protein